MKKELKAFYKELDQVKAEYVDRLKKQCIQKNKHWKREWAEIVKYDWDFDYDFLLNIILYKLKKMQLYLTTNPSSTHEWFDRIHREIDEAIKLGEKLQTYDYMKEAHDFLRKNTTPYVSIFENNLRGKELGKIMLPKHPDPEDCEDILEEYFGHDDLIDKWCKEQPIDRACVVCAYGSNWDSDAAEKEWKRKVRDAEKQEQKDREAFFLYIARHLVHWWN